MNLAIVSSIDESCGNSTFSQHLIDNINKSGNSAVGIGLPLIYTQSLNPIIRKIANKKIEEICNELGAYDGVNIQFEAGLYGSTHRDVYRRLKRLLAANPKTTVTLHATRFFDHSSDSLSKSLRELRDLKFKASLNTFSRYLNNTRILRNNRRYVRLCVKKKVKLITHTQKARDAVLAITNNSSTFLHPIKFTDSKIVKSNSTYWLKRLNLKSEDYLIGIFGYISKYKGIETAISALELLPFNYKLLIAGRQHPGNIREHITIDPYLNSLLNQIKEVKEKNFHDRIIFINELNDSELMNLAATVDCAWLPYLETGQDGSGIASILFDLSQRVVASQCKVFDELIRLVPEYKCERFDIGNYMELANKTVNYVEYRNLDLKLSYSDDSQTNLYLKLLSE